MPEFLLISLTAYSTGSAGWYARTEVIASKASETRTTLLRIGMSVLLSPNG